MYVLMGAFGTEDGIVPVLMEVKEFTDDRGNVLYLTVSMHEIKEADVVTYVGPVATTGDSYVQSASTYRIEDILKNVNTKDGALLKYIPDKFLNEAQKAAKKEALQTTKKYIETKNKKNSVENANGDLEPHPEYWKTERVGEEREVKPIGEIIADIQHDFGLNITTGHIRGAGVRGQYDSETKGIRIKIVNDLPTAAHELGHALNHKSALS